MRFVALFLASAALLAACAPVEPTPDIDAIVEATVAAREQNLLQPRLLAPEDGIVIDDPTQATLNWHWVRPLDDDEFFDVRVWREGEPDYGITWAKESSFDLTEWLSERETGEYFWSVAVLKGSDGNVEALLADAPAPQRFIVETNALLTPTPEPSPEPLTVADILELPEGFSATIFAIVEDAPTAITAIDFTDSGDLLALAIDGRLYRIHDADKDGVADEISQILSQDLSFNWAVGMALYEDRIYISDGGRVGYVEDTDDDGIYETYTIIIEGLPSLLYPLHSNNGIIFDSAGKLYVAVGSTTDHGPLQVEYEASILRMNPDGSEVEVFATGFRNPYDLTMSPNDELFTADNAADRLDEILTFLPPEELNYVREGRDYGFPDVYGDGLALRGADRESEPPVTEFITSVVTTGLTYYSEDQFPEEYRDSVFVAQFGGEKNGFMAVHVPLQPTEDGGYTGEWKEFIRFQPGFRPLAVEQGPDGALYLNEWTHGYILRIVYSSDDEGAG